MIPIPQCANCGGTLRPGARACAVCRTPTTRLGWKRIAAAMLVIVLLGVMSGMR